MFRLSLLRLEAKLKREEKENDALKAAEERRRRCEAIHYQFVEWEGGRKVDLALVSFLTLPEVISALQISFA